MALTFTWPDAPQSTCTTNESYAFGYQSKSVRKPCPTSGLWPNAKVCATTGRTHRRSSGPLTELTISWLGDNPQLDGRLGETRRPSTYGWILPIAVFGNSVRNFTGRDGPKLGSELGLTPM
jgi:hypothetical protein